MVDNFLNINGTDQLLINAGTDQLIISPEAAVGGGYGTYLRLNQKTWREFDFSTINKLSGTLFADKAMTTPRDLTGSTLKIRIYRRWRRLDRFNKSATITNPTAGTWEYTVAKGEMPRRGIYLLEVEIISSGVQESTFPVEFFVQGSPSG